jgi:putative transposase
MPNYVHRILVPADASGLRDALTKAHRGYTRMINFREGWQGQVWQERFHSFVMDEQHLLAAARYVERNPGRARLGATPQDRPWSSAQAHLARADDALVGVRPLLELISGWNTFIGNADAADIGDMLQVQARAGRPLGSDAFAEDLERRLQRPVKRQKPGPHPIGARRSHAGPLRTPIQNYVNFPRTRCPLHLAGVSVMLAEGARCPYCCHDLVARHDCRDAQRGRLRAYGRSASEPVAAPVSVTAPINVLVGADSLCDLSVFLPTARLSPTTTQTNFGVAIFLASLYRETGFCCGVGTAAECRPSAPSTES